MQKESILQTEIESIYSSLRNEGIDPHDETVEQKISALSKDALIRIHRTSWSNSQRQFCRKYGLDAANFSKFIQGKKSSTSSVGAIRTYLIDAIRNPQNYESLLPPSNENTELQIGPPLNSLYFETKRLAINVKAMVFIDGDNNINSLRTLNSINNLGIQVSLFLGPLSPIPKWSRHYANCEWLNYYRSSTSVKNAADFSMTFHIATLNIALLEYINVPFFIVTNDLCAKEISGSLSLFNRPFFLVDEKSTNLQSYLDKKLNFMVGRGGQQKTDDI